MKLFLRSFILLGLISSIIGIGLNLNYEDHDDNSINDDLVDEDRAIFVVTAPQGNLLGLNLSQILPFFALSALGLAPLLLLLAVGLLLSSATQRNNNFGFRSLTDSHFGLDLIQWENFSILDWISVAEESYRNFEPSNIDCHKRFICEVHQNVRQFGNFAEKFVEVFGYLHYTEVFSLPEGIHELVQDYIDAADRGRTLKKDCGIQFSDCDFSFKKLYDTFSFNHL